MYIYMYKYVYTYGYKYMYAYKHVHTYVHKFILKHLYILKVYAHNNFQHIVCHDTWQISLTHIHTLKCVCHDACC